MTTEPPKRSTPAQKPVRRRARARRGRRSMCSGSSWGNGCATEPCELLIRLLTQPRIGVRWLLAERAARLAAETPPCTASHTPWGRYGLPRPPGSSTGTTRHHAGRQVGQVGQRGVASGHDIDLPPEPVCADGMIDRDSVCAEPGAELGHRGKDPPVHCCHVNLREPCASGSEHADAPSQRGLTALNRRGLRCCQQARTRS